MHRSEGLSDQPEWALSDHYSPAAMEVWTHKPKVHQAMQQANDISRRLCAEHGVESTLQLPADVRSELEDAIDRVNESVWET